MKKWIFLGIFILILLIAILVAAAVAYVAPYYLFSKAINQGIQHEYLNLPKSPPQFIFPTRFVRREADNDVFQGQDNLWMNFHLGNFVVPMPMHHPYFIMIPNIGYKFDDPQNLKLGVIFVEPHTKSEYVSFLSGEKFSLELEIGRQKIFNLPIFKKYIEEKKQQTLWQDLFTLDVTGGLKLYSESFNWKQLYEGASKFWMTPKEEWVYRLYLLEKRSEFFKGNVLNIDFKEKNQIGITKIKTDDTRMLQEVFYIPEGKNVYTINFKTYPWDPVSRGIRKKYLETLELKMSTPEASYSIYNTYSKLPYNIKIDQEGLTYLYSAWSHQTASKDFLRMMIRFLEKGKDYSMQTTPLYEFAYRRFGTNFSTREDTVKEDSETRLKRKMGEELEKQLSDEERKKLPDSEGNFQSEDAKMNYFLNKAKEKGLNSDSDGNSLINE